MYYESDEAYKSRMRYSFQGKSFAAVGIYSNSASRNGRITQIGVTFIKDAIIQEEMIHLYFDPDAESNETMKNITFQAHAPELYAKLMSVDSIILHDKEFVMHALEKEFSLSNLNFSPKEIRSTAENYMDMFPRRRRIDLYTVLAAFGITKDRISFGNESALTYSVLVAILWQEMANIRHDKREFTIFPPTNK